MIAKKHLSLSPLLLWMVLVGLAWGKSSHSQRDSVEERRSQERESNSMKVDSSFRISMPLFMRNAAVDDAIPRSTNAPPPPVTTTTQTPSSMPPSSNNNSLICLNGGTVGYRSDGSYKCNCSSRYRGDFCEISIQCSDINANYIRHFTYYNYNYNCKNGGELVYNPLSESCSCSCPPCYDGLTCEFYNSNCINITEPTNSSMPLLYESCRAKSCLYGWQIRLNETDCKCVCYRGHSGEYCELYNTLYDNFECHAGTPYHDPTSYTTKCACPTGHYGDNCEYITSAHLATVPKTEFFCNSYMCLNGGTYEYGSNGSCWCRCPIGFQGDLCEYRQECVYRSGLICSNGGTPSLNPTLGRCACSCPSCFYGSNCEFYDSNCNSSSSSMTQITNSTRPTCSTLRCLKGMIVQSNNTSCECACAYGYSGEYCDLYQTLRRNLWCNHVGTLYNDPQSQSVKCVCAPGYYGDYCEMRM